MAALCKGMHLELFWPFVFQTALTHIPHTTWLQAVYPNMTNVTQPGQDDSDSDLDSDDALWKRRAETAVERAEHLSKRATASKTTTSVTTTLDENEEVADSVAAGSATLPNPSRAIRTGAKHARDKTLS